ncbi:MAG TPA: hypothetical protein VGJ82_18735 [Thermoanaerobaculia bacterium]
MANHVTIGSLNGALAPHFQANEAGAQFKGDQAVVLSGKTVTALTPAQQEALAAAFSGGRPIVLLNPTVAEVNQLHAVAGTGQRDPRKTPLARYEAYGINREPSGDVWQAVFLPAVETANVGLQIKHVDDDGRTVTGELSLGTKVFQAAQTGDTAARAEAVTKWIAEAGSRKKPETKAAKTKLKRNRSRAADTPGDVNELTSLASANVIQLFYYAGNPGQVNQYQLTSFTYSCFQQNTGESWFYIQNFWVMAAANAYVKSGDQQNYWYADNYSMNTWPTDYQSDPASVSTIQSSPVTTTGSTTTTSGVSYNVGGTVGYQDGGVVGSVSGGMSIDNSTTINIPDVSVSNNTNSSGNNANWSFSMPRCTGIDDGCVNSMTEPKAVSISTFQPLNQWIMRVADYAYSDFLDLTIQLNSEWCNSYMGECNIFGCNCDIDTQTWAPGFGPVNYSVPFPPHV